MIIVLAESGHIITTFYMFVDARSNLVRNVVNSKLGSVEICDSVAPQSSFSRSKFAIMLLNWGHLQKAAYSRLIIDPIHWEDLIRRQLHCT